ncbi:MAG: hypothetical protein IH598_12865 [Bacteroidales bacterium]|nr:hypothetical protein [Bacteroidales bacterium]
MLYNPNNVVGEASPATTKMELDYINSLCKMVGYKSCDKLKGTYSWGHLCSGGTTANIEAMWVARNIKYYPLSVKLASILIPECGFLGDAWINSSGKDKDIKSLSFNDLFNLPFSEILDLKDEIYKLSQQVNISALEMKTMIDKYAVTNMGVYGIHHKIETLEVNKEQIDLPKVYIAKSNHYSWEKALDIIGLGRDQLIKIDIDHGFRMNIEDLKNKFRESGSPTLAVIGILGSSKQGSIDPIDEIVDFRSKKESEGYSFVIHIDGAYGGYFPAVFKQNAESDEFSTDEDILNYLREKRNNLFYCNNESTINNKWCEKIKAISKSDSIAIDPHKMGYIPYPAGSILFADTRMKDFISYEPSYLNKPTDSKDLGNAFLGQWTLEGSRPGAAAAACYLSNLVLPFNQSGHGQLIRNSMYAADIFWNSIKKFNEDVTINMEFQVNPLYIPETNIVSYVVSAPNIIRKTKFLNKLNNLLYEIFSVKGDSIIPAQNFIIAKDAFDYQDIPNNTLLTSCGIDEENADNTQDKITILSSVFMNPLSEALHADFYLDFFKEAVNAGLNIRADIMLEILNDKFEGERIKVLWVEDDDDIHSLRKQLLQDFAVGKCLDISFVNNVDDAIIELTKKWDIYILDLNLKSKHDLNSNRFIQKDKDEIESSLQLYQSIPEADRENILFYSAYLHHREIKEERIIPLLNPLFKNTTKLKDQLISKTGEYLIDKQKIINGIFSIIQK